MSKLGVAALLLALAGCGYSPPAQTDTAASGYKTDLKACHETSEAAVSKQNAKRALAWIASPVRRWSQIGDATGSCMAEKGYGQLRWCRDGELAAARRSGSVVVTSAGLKCVEAPTSKPR